MGAMVRAASGVRPRLQAIGIGASMCATLKWPTASRSRMLAQEFSRTSISSTPSSAAKPFSRAATSKALSSSGRKPARHQMAHDAILRSKQSGRRDEALRDLADLAVLVHGCLAQQRVGLLLGKPARLHQNALGAVDQLAVLQLRARIFEFARHAREGVETADSHVEDRLDAFLAQPVDDVGRHARINRRLDRGRVRSVDEHRDRPLHRARQLEHVLQHIAVGVFEIDDDDVRLQRRRCAPRCRPRRGRSSRPYSPASRNPSSMTAARMRFSSMTSTSRGAGFMPAFCLPASIVQCKKSVMGWPGPYTGFVWKAKKEPGWFIEGLTTPA